MAVSVMVTFSKVKIEWQSIFHLLDLISVNGNSVEILQSGFLVSISLGALLIVSTHFSSETEKEIFSINVFWKS